MASSSRQSRGWQRGSIGWLPNGSARVKVYAGIDQPTGKDLLQETVPARAMRRETERAAEVVLPGSIRVVQAILSGAFMHYLRHYSATELIAAASTFGPLPVGLATREAALPRSGPARHA